MGFAHRVAIIGAKNRIGVPGSNSNHVCCTYIRINSLVKRYESIIKVPSQAAFFGWQKNACQKSLIILHSTASILQMKCRKPRGRGSQEDTTQITKSSVKPYAFYIPCALLTSSSSVHQPQLIITYLERLIGPVLDDQLVKELKHCM